MLRGNPSITAILGSVCTLAACSSANPAEPTGTATAAAALTPQCSHGGASIVTLVSFDADALELQAVNARGQWIVGRLTPDTVEVPANLRAFPPDPIFPQCTDDATAYNAAVGSGLTGTLLGDLGELANDGCNASLTLTANGTVTSLQPVP